MDRFAELRRLRAEGKTKRDLNFNEEDGKIYDELDEAEYEKRQRERLREDDFVVDDDGSGYVDNGEYEWDQPQQLSQDENEDAGGGDSPGSSAKKRKPDIISLFKTQKKPRTAAPAPQIAPKVNVDDILNKLGGARTPKSTTKRPNPPSSLGSANKFGSLGMLNRFNTKLNSATKPALRSAVRAAAPGPSVADTPTKSRKSEQRNQEQQLSEGEEAPMIGDSVLNDHTIGMEPSSDPPSFSMEPVALTTGNGLNDDDEDSDNEFLEFLSSKANSEMPSSELPSSHYIHPSSPPEHKSNLANRLLEDEDEDEEEEEENSSELITGAYASDAWNLVSDSVVEPEKSEERAAGVPETLRFYWIDYMDMQGGLILFGKDTNGKGVTVFVYGIERDVYLLPKEGSSLDSVASEVREFFFQNGVDRLRSKPVKLRDVFANHKEEMEYLHVKAPFTLRSPLPLTGETYQSIHGMHSSRIETFLVGKNIMGPCWLDVKIQRASKGTTWTGAAYDCNSPAHVKVVEDVTEVPKLTLLSCTVTTIPNAKNEHELVSISLRVFHNVDHAEHDATKLPSFLITGMRPPPSKSSQVCAFPPGFKQAITEHNASRAGGKLVLETFSNEQKLISWFFNVLKQHDPDVLIGHNLTNIHLATILERALALQLPNWAQLGRYKISRKPQSVKTMEVQRVCSGRLLVDLRNTFGEEIASGKCTEFSLEEMCRVFLDQRRLPFDTNLASGDWLDKGSSGLVEIVRRSEYDTLFVTSIALKNQMLPLSRQLTCLAGNPWRATLAGTRSGRNDYLLMHEFFKNGFLIPDKQNKLDKNNAPVTTYTGGHVFDPVAGLHQSCVLVMDFNSLYPSIIQEYNICLTTVDFQRDQTESPDVPPSTVPQGLLPKILQNLVERRREVKNLMKSNSATPAQLAEWNIRQTALKLTANSMYGCLGFSDSRFCAKPLAQLITQKGREALLRTRDLAIEKGLEVLYGDTDSVMINTNAVKYADAYAIGVDFKRAVNKQYRLMEIDIDHVFRKLLLYLKKKYAAVIMSPDGSLKLECKGLDMRRREFSEVCKTSSTNVLKIIFGMDDNNTESQSSDDIADPIEIFSKVYEYCHEYASRVRAGKVPPRMFVMRNQLSKELSQYTTYDKPQLVVAARRLEAGFSVRAKDVINYIITEDSGNEKKSVAERAVSPEELGKRQLVPDYEWYLQNQVFVPINRFCEKVDGYDSVQLAEAMELKNASELKQTLRRSEGQKSNLYDGLQLVTLLQDSQRFAHCDKLELKFDGNTFVYEGVNELQAEGIIEPKSGKVVPFSEVAQQVEDAIRSYISKFYQIWLICDDCNQLTRSPTSYLSLTCPQKECSGALRPQYSSQWLYTQMCYIASLFDASRAKSKTANAIVHGTNQEGLRMVEEVAQKYIRRSGYNYVNIGQYFC